MKKLFLTAFAFVAAAFSGWCELPLATPFEWGEDITPPAYRFYEHWNDWPRIEAGNSTMAWNMPVFWVRDHVASGEIPFEEGFLYTGGPSYQYDYSDGFAALQNASQVVDFGGDLGRCLVINGKNSTLQDKLAAMGVGVDLRNYDQDAGASQLLLFAMPDPGLQEGYVRAGRSNFRVRITMNAYHGFDAASFGNPMTANIYANDDQNNVKSGTGAINNVIDWIDFDYTWSERTPENPYDEPYFNDNDETEWNPYRFMVYEFDATDVRYDEDFGMNYFRLKWMIHPSVFTQDAALIIRSIEFFVNDSDELYVEGSPYGNVKKTYQYFNYGNGSSWEPQPPVVSGIYLRGDMNDWGTESDWKFTYDEAKDVYSLACDIPAYTEFKIADEFWGTVNYGNYSGPMDLFYDQLYHLEHNSGNMSLTEDFHGTVFFKLDGAYSAHMVLSESGEYSGDYKERPVDVYLRGEVNDWECRNEWKFTYDEENDEYTLVCKGATEIPAWSGFQIGDAQWRDIVFGLEYPIENIDSTEPYRLQFNAPNIMLADDFDGTITFKRTGQYEAYMTLNVDDNYNAPIVVNVAVPGSLIDELDNAGVAPESISWLVVKGTPNDYDLRQLRRMTKLRTLDLSESTGFKTMTGCNGLRRLKTVLLPEGIITIGENAFEETAALDSIIMPSTVRRIENMAFNNSGLKYVYLNNVDSISYRAFGNTGLRSIDLMNVSYLEYEAFIECRNLETITWSNRLERIQNHTFGYCTSLTEVRLPETIEVVEGWAFGEDYNLKYIEIGEKTYVGNGAFAGSNPETVICHSVFPKTESGFSLDWNNLSQTVLYVPALTCNEYRSNPLWRMFTTIKPLDEDLTEVTVSQPFDIAYDGGIADNASVINKSALRVSRPSALNLSAYTHEGSIWSTSVGNDLSNLVQYGGATVVAPTPVTAESVKLVLQFSDYTWNFFTLPFDVNVKDIQAPENTLWVIRKYSGEDRANLTGDTWHNMTDNSVLRAGEGYILHCTHYGNDYKFVFTPATDGNALFSNEDIKTELNEYKSDYPHNDSWNLVGNTYPAFVNIRNVDFTGPITVWKSNSANYYAYSALDDDYVISPFEAFFVQRFDEDALVIKSEGRELTPEAAQANRPYNTLAVSAADRAVFNLTLSGESASDRTRVVLNSLASEQYEKNRDAAKFMSTDADVPQIYVMNNGVNMAIDERPLGNGEVALGARFGSKGIYTIALDARNASAYSAMLYDAETGVTTNLMSDTYTFNAEAGTDNNRFILTFNVDVTGVNDGTVAAGVNINVAGNTLNVASNNAVEIVVSSVDGKVVVADRADSLSIDLADGVYIVKAGNKVEKVVIGK